MSSVLKSEHHVDTCVEMFLKRMGDIADSSTATTDIAHWFRLVSSFFPVIKLFNWKIRLTSCDRFSFDVIGELYFSNMFGFMREGRDHLKWIDALDTFMPHLIKAALLPSWVRPPYFATTLATTSEARKAARDYSGIENAVEDCVVERQNKSPDERASREDILGRFFEIHQEKGEKLDFTIDDIKTEVHIALYVSISSFR